MDAEPRVKVCGLTRADEALACAAAGVWGVGVVLAPESPRRLSVAEAAAVLAHLPDEVARVGVFVAPRPDELASAAAACRLTHVQIHGVGGDEGVAGARAATGLPVIEAIHVDGPGALERARASAADLVLLDAAVPGRHGGTGTAFDWSLLDGAPLGRPFGLAGGLRPDTVAQAIARVRPDLVDVASGVERVPGRKDLARVRAFVTAVKGSFPTSPSFAAHSEHGRGGRSVLPTSPPLAVQSEHGRGGRSA